MRKTIIILITGIAISGLISCNTDPDGFKGQSRESQPSSETYKPARFLIDNRKEWIGKQANLLHRLIELRSSESHIPGIAYGIVVDDELVVASSTGFIDLEKKIPASTKSAFRIASMTKSFTAMAIMRLRDEGSLDLYDPVFSYIPEMTGLAYLTSDTPPITIRNLLTMTAGFPEDNPWGDRQLDEPDQMLLNLISEGISFSNPVDYRYEYSNTGYAMLGYIISRVSGQPYQEYIRENILKPLGMTHTYWEFDSIPEDILALGYRWEDGQWKKEPILHDGSFGAMGGLITTIEDFSKYVSFHLSAYPPRNDPENGPVRRSTLREMHQPQFPSLDNSGTDWNGNPCAGLAGYGYGLGIHEDCHGIRQVRHGGALPGFGSHYTFLPEYGIGIMAFGNLTYTRPYVLEDIIQLLLDTDELQPRKLPASEILLERQEQVTQMIRTWEPDLEEQILAENFYLDRSRDHRKAEIDEIMRHAGNILSIDVIKALNQLRGWYEIKCENGIISVFFTLTPERNPRIQQLNVYFKAKGTQDPF